ncbi:uncharacterized protein A4U43_C07F28560 [Asparagus officinalis]|uniref:Knottin scorpion toxin-like domain-containing protein n=1 Tax=Asparagus officinalis TaxID=4686 RepID=A0A5P1EFK2_ASPOF|nr:uncharacterized protein A4U43_C07F28560 [Asparagus officinalis]
MVAKRSASLLKLPVTITLLALLISTAVTGGGRGVSDGEGSYNLGTCQMFRYCNEACIRANYTEGHCIDNQCYCINKSHAKFDFITLCERSPKKTISWSEKCCKYLRIVRKKITVKFYAKST